MPCKPNLDFFFFSLVNFVNMKILHHICQLNLILIYPNKIICVSLIEAEIKK